MNIKNKYTTYKEIPVWQLTHKYVIDVYSITNEFPKTEIFGLTSQLRRAAVSVASNIVEGCNRKTRKELIQFLFQAKGSLVESEYQLFLAKDLQYIKISTYEVLYQQYNEIHYQLNSWIKFLSINH